MIPRIAALVALSMVTALGLAQESQPTPQTSSTLTGSRKTHASVSDGAAGDESRGVRVIRSCVAKQLPRVECVPVEDPKGPPLPFHTIEGYGGGSITPMAYLVNPGPKDCIFGNPSVAATGVMMQHGKNLEALTISDTLFRRLELSYGLDRFDIGNLYTDIRRATKVDIGRDDVYLNNFNARALLLEENCFGSWTPAITAGVHYKVNEGISDIDKKLAGALKSIGYNKSSGVEFTLVGSKTIKQCWTLDRPLIVSAGLRNSNAAQLGFLGFGEERATTFEGNIVYLPTDNFLVGYEYRQKHNPYGQIPGLIGEEDNWQAIDASWIMNKHMTLTGGLGLFGNITNSKENNAWFLQYKVEF